MNQMNPNTDQRNIDIKHRGIVISWLAMLFSTGLFIFISRIAAPSSENPPGGADETNWMVLLGCAVAGVLTFAVSFAFKRKFLKQAVEKRDLQSVVSGHTLAFALCEATCLFGLTAYFVTHSPYAYLLFALAVLGLLLHFPRRAHFADAAGERQRFGM